MKETRHEINRMLHFQIKLSVCRTVEQQQTVSLIDSTHKYIYNCKIICRYHNIPHSYVYAATPWVSLPESANRNWHIGGKHDRTRCLSGTQVRRQYYEADNFHVKMVDCVYIVVKYTHAIIYIHVCILVWNKATEMKAKANNKISIQIQLQLRCIRNRKDNWEHTYTSMTRKWRQTSGNGNCSSYRKLLQNAIYMEESKKKGRKKPKRKKENVKILWKSEMYRIQTCSYDLLSW